LRELGGIGLRDKVGCQRFRHFIVQRYDMKMKRFRIFNYVAVLFVLLAVVYLGAVLKYQSPNPSDIFKYISGTTWTVDSTIINRAIPIGRRLSQSPDSLTRWYYEVDIFARNNIRQPFTFDSVIVSKRADGSFLGRLLLTSAPIRPGGTFEFHQLIVRREFSKEPEPDTSVISKAFAERTMRFIFFTSRGRFESDVQYYRAPERLGLSVM
jgi:hypothetical protein